MGRQTRSSDEKAEYVKNLHRYIAYYLRDFFSTHDLVFKTIRIGQIVMERGIRPWLTIDWIYQFSSLGRENQKCVKALHAFTNQVGKLVYYKGWFQRHFKV